VIHKLVYIDVRLWKHSGRFMFSVTVNFSGTQPAIVHAHGRLALKPYWEPIRSAYFASSPCPAKMPAGLTIITCNNGHPELGLFERSLAHQGLSCTVLGRDVVQWLNSRDKPRVIAEAARMIETEYLMYVDSRDAVMLHSPEVALAAFLESECDLLFGGDRLSWPPINTFKRFEDNLPGARATEFRYLNGGGWIGRTKYAAEFFDEAMKRTTVKEVPDSEQGLLRQVLQESGSRACIDHRCSVFLNIGFLLAPGALTMTNSPMVEKCSAEQAV
jgi:hypothetical protein